MYKPTIPVLAPVGNDLKNRVVVRPDILNLSWKFLDVGKKKEGKDEGRGRTTGQKTEDAETRRVWKREEQGRKKERRERKERPEGNARPSSIVSLSHRTTIGWKNGTHRVVGCAGGGGGGCRGVAGARDG